MQLGHTLIPAALRDTGSGLYHLIKRDATQEHCQKLIAGTIRFAGAAATILATLAAVTALPASWMGLGMLTIVTSVSIIDTETFALFAGSTIATMGVIGLAASVYFIANELFTIGLINAMLSLLFIPSGWFLTRLPKDIPWDRPPDLLTNQINQLSESWGKHLFLAFA